MTQPVALRHCPFCGTTPIIQHFHPSGEYVLQHAEATGCPAAAVVVMGETAEACAAQWNERRGQEYAIASAFDAVVMALLRDKPEAAKTILRRAINGNKGDDARAIWDYWQGWLTEAPITMVRPTPITAAALSLFAHA